jgi:hypothetical protein
MAARDADTIGRRDFFHGLGTATIAAAYVLYPTSADPTPTAAPQSAADDMTRARYRETDHVMTFYRVNQYPRKR